MKKIAKTREITPEFAEKVRSDQKVRRKLAYESPLWFALIYLPHHFSSPFAPFHIEMFRIMEDPKYEFVCVMAFRGSGKSTVMNTANVLWSILGKPERKFAIIVSKTQEQAKNHFSNIKRELEANALLTEDFGPFSGNEAAWNKMSLELEYRGAKLLSISREQSVRGLRHGAHRPDLVVCDDLEDDEDEGGADPIYRRLHAEIATACGFGARIFVLGNLISDKSLLVLLKRDIDAGKRPSAIFRAYPFRDVYKNVLWKEGPIGVPAMDMSGVWEREYLLDATAASSSVSPAALSEIGFHPTPDMIARAEKLLPLVMKANRKYLRAKEKAGDMKCQEPLVAAMRRFHIDSPKTEGEAGILTCSVSGDHLPEYAKEFNDEMDRILNSSPP